MTFLVSKNVRENNPLILNKSFTLFQHKQTKKKKEIKLKLYIQRPITSQKLNNCIQSMISFWEENNI